MNENGYSYIDLFAGAGGLSEGFIQCGFQPIAHVEMNPNAAKTLETRVAYYYLRDHNNIGLYREYEKKQIDRGELLNNIPKSELETVINAEISEATIRDIFSTIDLSMAEKGINHVDVVIGGPPCQAYSLVGRAQSSHMIVPMEEDPRNELYKMYMRFLKKYQPKMLVFENVAGIKTARGGQAFKNLQSYMKRVGYEFEWHELNAKNFGVLQSRKRIIIIGWLKESGCHYPDFPETHHNAIVNDLLIDLPAIGAGESCNHYGVENMNIVSPILKDFGLRERGDVLTAYEARPHTAQDLEIYRRTIDMWNNTHERLKYDDLPEELKTHRNRTSFVDRFKVVEGDMAYCHTILAHLSKDGHYFIHPSIDHPRSLTVREAARIQSFPDNYYFEGARTAQFVQVGNAVPPIMAKQIAEKIKEQLENL